jgi:iron(III) transport system permease protein
MHYYAFAYIMVSGSLRSINSELEEMAEIQGANKFQILKGVTFPLVMPAFMSAFIMTLSKSIGSFGVAANLGLRIGYYTLATKMYNAIDDMDRSTGYAIGLILICSAAIVIFLNQRITGKRKSYATIGGKGGHSTPIPLGKLTPIVFLLLLVFLFCAMVMPFFFLIMESFQISTGGGYGLDNLTLYNWIGQLDMTTALESGTDNYPGIFHNPEFGKAALNTVKLTFITAVITSFFGQLAGYITARGRGKWWGDTVEQLIFIPYLMPAISFSAIYLAMWSVRRLIIPSLYGTFTLVVLTSIVKHLPFASRAGTANMLQISSELEEAADIEGAGFWRRMATIVVPLAKQGFLSGFMLIFISIAKELDLIILLMTPNMQTLSYLTYTYNNNLQPQMADATSLVMMAFILLCYWASNTFAGADISKSM